MYTVFPRLSATFGETVNIGGKRGWRMIENKKIQHQPDDISSTLH